MIEMGRTDRLHREGGEESGQTRKNQDSGGPHQARRTLKNYNLPVGAHIMVEDGKDRKPARCW